MSRKLFKPVLMASVAMLTIGITGIPTAGASSANKVTICYNRKNGIVHYAPSGKCAKTQTAVVVGRGIVGARGALGLVGGTGAPGPAGGPQGVMGPQGIQGPDGVPGPAGARGLQGFQGIVGPQGVIGPVGGTGVAGPPGNTGATGVAAFHIVFATSTAPAATITATCGAGQVATGGGFAAVLPAIVTSSVAHAGGVSWDVSFSGNTGTVTAQAICAVGTETP